MIRHKRSILVLLVLALSLVILAGCTTSGTQNEPKKTDEKTDVKKDDAAKTMTLEVVTQWAMSRHAQVVVRAATEEGCKNCHDGLTFTTTGGGFRARMTSSSVDASEKADANDHPSTLAFSDEPARPGVTWSPGSHAAAQQPS